MEIWDAYDRNFKKIEGLSLIRGEPVPDGQFHLVSEVIVRHQDGSYLLMQRAAEKHFGGMWEATAGGSALQGETAAECAARELEEETGIIPDQLQEIGRVVHERHRTIYVEYLCVTACEKSSVRLQRGETSAFQWVSRDVLYHMPKQELVTQRIQNFIEELSN